MEQRVSSLVVQLKRLEPMMAGKQSSKRRINVLGRIDNHIGSLVDLLPHKWKPVSLVLSY